ncbi:uracil-DNA glycosylase [Haematospirillum jordaniae]|uniref:Type-5 uracil-DNA glycosylase n=3 Tax=Haematospirillum jordaniae TaxID=1549855 RepID=A0A143DEW1_9PROT|nr:uracil-DNA glycosylase [Haematospirillum jordaniae]
MAQHNRMHLLRKMKMLLPDHNCSLCPRLSHYIAEARATNPGWFNGPVHPFGDRNARLLIVGLAPGLRGANRTGRPFTGDFAGEVLYPTLVKYGLAQGVFRADPSDGLELSGARVTNAVKCVPPENKPTPEEQRQCRHFLAADIAAMPDLRAILALGRIAHDSVLTVLNERRSQWPFAHGRIHHIPGKTVVVDTYHTSRYNVNTGRLTLDMFERVIESLLPILDA